MTRWLTGAALIALWASPIIAQKPPAVTTPAPRITLARAAEGKIIIEEIVPVTRVITETRTVTENGMTKNVAVAVPVTTLEIQQRSHLLKEVKAYDMDGRTVTPGRLENALKERCAVAIGGLNGKLDPIFKKIFRDDTLVLVLPELPVEP